MKEKIKIGIILPNKEDYTLNNAAAASIWVKEYNQGSLTKITQVFGNCTSVPLTKNFTNLYEKKITVNSYYYLINFIHKLPKTVKIIEIHNRPHFFFFLKEKLPNIKFILIFHNDPIGLRGSKSTKERKEILEKCDNIIFVSSYVKKKFFEGLNDYLPISGDIVYPASNYYNHNFKKKLCKKKIIVFVGKLNHAKGYDSFGVAVINILNKFNDWKAVVHGNEKREHHIFKHKNLIVNNWISHRNIINLYKKSSISVVPSSWAEPFGRTAMESSDMGNAVITSGTGGLFETSCRPIILKKINSKHIEKEITKLIKNPRLLKKIQNFNYKNLLINYNLNSYNLNTIKKKLLLTEEIKSFNIKKNLITVLHIANFDEKNNFRLNNINIADKISNGFIKNNIKTINFSDRFYSKLNTLSSIDDKVLNIIKSVRPNLLLLGHTNSLETETLYKAKNIIPDLRIAFWYEDSISPSGPDYYSNKKFIEKYIKYVDQYFVTTHKDYVLTSIKKNRINFMPIPCSETTEYLKLYQNQNPQYDVFFAISHGVNRGILKKEKIDDRFHWLKEFLSHNNQITFNCFGFNNIQPVWGDNYDREIAKCSFGLNLSRGLPIKYYSSNRVSSLIANGLPTLMDAKTKYGDFFSDKEIILYNNIEELIDKIIFYKKNNKKRILIGKNGKAKYFKLFNNKIVSDYIMSKSLNIPGKFIFNWQ